MNDQGECNYEEINNEAPKNNHTDSRYHPLEFFLAASAFAILSAAIITFLLYYDKNYESDFKSSVDNDNCRKLSHDKNWINTVCQFKNHSYYHFHNNSTCQTLATEYCDFTHEALEIIVSLLGFTTAMISVSFLLISMSTCYKSYRDQVSSCCSKFSHFYNKSTPPAADQDLSLDLSGDYSRDGNKTAAMVENNQYNINAR